MTLLGGLFYGIPHFVIGHHGIPPMLSPIDPFMCRLLLIEIAPALPSVAARLATTSRRTELTRVSCFIDLQFHPEGVDQSLGFQRGTVVLGG